MPKHVKLTVITTVITMLVFGTGLIIAIHPPFLYNGISFGHWIFFVFIPYVLYLIIFIVIWYLTYKSSWRVFKYFWIGSLRKYSTWVLIPYTIIATAVVYSLYSPPTSPVSFTSSQQPPQASGYSITMHDLAPVTALIASIFFTFLFNFLWMRRRYQGFTTNMWETIEESAEIYATGLSPSIVNCQPRKYVYAVSRCGQFSPYLLHKMDEWKDKKHFYSGVHLLLRSDILTSKKEMVHEIFGALLRKFRKDHDNSLIDTGIKLFLMPPEIIGPIILKKQDGSEYLCPRSIHPPDYKIVCSEVRAIIGQSIFCKPIDSVAALLENESPLSQQNRTDWTFKYFQWLFSNHCGEMALKEFGQTVVEGEKILGWDWSILVDWFKSIIGQEWPNIIRDWCDEYCKKTLRNNARREGNLFLIDIDLKTPKEILDRCIEDILRFALKQHTNLEQSQQATTAQ